MSITAVARRLGRAKALFAAATIAALGYAGPVQALDLAPSAARASDTGLAPGLAVSYVYDFVRHIDDIDGWDEAEAGDPLPRLDYRSGEGEVLGSGENNGVCAAIKGFIKFAKAGTWTLKVTSNDGVQVNLAGSKIIEDPDVHGDRDSPAIKVKVAKGGWYPLDIVYFERKGTSTLRLWWSPPDGGDFKIVPVAALSHEGT